MAVEGTVEPSRQTVQLLTLLQWPKVGPVKAREIACAAKPDQDLLEVAASNMPDIAAGLKGDRDRIDTVVNRITEDCLRFNISILSLRDREYPDRLRSIPNAPPIIYFRGNLDALNMPSVAVVGTRKVSESGTRAACLIASFVAKRGNGVVSGLALGIDAAAHRGALNAHGITIAVLAHGLDTIAPVTNRSIADELLETGGALVSEHRPGTPPRPAEFARRNRIQSGLSMCSIIVESGAEGGAMIQAKFTRDQGRPIITVLSSNHDFNLEGAKRLIAEYGAIAIRGTGDLCNALDRIENGKTSLSPVALAQTSMEW